MQLKWLERFLVNRRRLQFSTSARGVICSELDADWLTGHFPTHTSTLALPAPDWLNATARYAANVQGSLSEFKTAYETWRPKHHISYIKPRLLDDSCLHSLSCVACGANGDSVDGSWSRRLSQHQKCHLNSFQALTRSCVQFKCSVCVWRTAGRLNWISSNEQKMRFYDAFNFNWIKIGLNSSTPVEVNECGCNDYHGTVVLSLDLRLRNNIWIK